jgi:hypothetical protein
MSAEVHIRSAGASHHRQSPTWTLKPRCLAR